MNCFLRSRVGLVVLGVALGAPLAGCQQDSHTAFERYVPSPEAMKTHLEHAMEGWLKGLPPGESGSEHPEVHIVDQTRRPDQKLVRYEILGEVPAENARAFAVRVTYDRVEEPEVLQFFAIGVDPMWIFRREDYEGIWQHDLEAPADRAGEPAKTP